MRVTWDMYRRLGKEKREEYKERYGELKETVSTSVHYIFLKYSIFLMALFIIAIPLWKLAYPDLVVSIMTILIFGLRILVAGAVAGLIADIMFAALFLFRVEKLKQEYFGRKR
jgi:steroid 5-alpha reductase family enzyme